MKIIRFEYKGKQDWGVIRNEIIHTVTGDLFKGVTESKETVPLGEVKVLPPVSPSKIVGVGANYYEFIKEQKLEIPDEPRLFFKPPSSIIGHLDHIIRPDRFEDVIYEGELGVVIGKKAKNITESQALDYVFGYTIVNDVTVRDYAKKGIRSAIDKGLDTFCPFGPVIVTDIDPDNLNLEIRLNGKTTRTSNTKNLVFKTAYLVSFISSIMTLLPGDLVPTGTPGIGPIRKGDVVEIEIEGIGILKNFVS
jgi:2-keto-4-pentenoate hydratase/2-oxohepta-3-ene-1,7-dioic acid hydratase in catechol pathway